MNTLPHDPGPPGSCYELRFEFLYRSGRAFAFPCDAIGRVDRTALSERARRNYDYARSVIGREVAVPDIRLAGLQ